MFSNMNALLIGGTYFLIFLLIGPGLAEWIWENSRARKERLFTNPAIPLQSSSKKPPIAA